jgi:hypothetical protein
VHDGMDKLLSLFIWVSLSLIESSIAGHILYQWVEKEAFRGFSKTRIKKIKKQYPFWRRIPLLYLIRLCGSKNVNKRVAVYWLYWLDSISFGCIICWRDVFPDMFLRFMFLIWLGKQGAIYILWKLRGRGLR